MSEISRIFPLGHHALGSRAPEPPPAESQAREHGPLGPPPVSPRAAEPPLLGPRTLEPLWREVLGSRLRALRADRGETLVQTAERAGISPQYLSEVERGRKEPSSEMIAALAGALDLTVADLMAGAAEDLRRHADAFVKLTLGTTVTSSTVTRFQRPGPQRPSGPLAMAA